MESTGFMSFWTSSHCRRWLLQPEAIAHARSRQRREGGFDDDELTLLLARENTGHRAS